MTSPDRPGGAPAPLIRRRMAWLGLAAALAAALLALVSMVSAGILLRHHERLGLEPQLLMPAFLDAAPMPGAPGGWQVAGAAAVPLQPETLHDIA